LSAAYAEAEAADPACMLLNFAQVGFINSTGIALIIGLLARARAAQRPLLAYGLSGHDVAIFAVTRLADLICICEDEPRALEAAGQQAQPPGLNPGDRQGKE
jgi:anti-anti-sigma regulatory factor